MELLMKKKLFPLLIPALLCSACVSLVEHSGRILDGSAFAEKDLTVYRRNQAEKSGKPGGGDEKKDIELRQVRSKDGAESIVISGEDFPALRLRGSVPGSDGSFYLKALYFLGGNITGWNEFTLDLSGTGTFIPQGERAILKLREPIEFVQISAGKILHNGKRLIGDEALTSLRNRHERILALAEWMHSRDETPLFKSQDDFENYWKPVLLPELASAKERPPGWVPEEAVWVRGEDINWNKTYTEILFSEDLWVLRNSGALLRDWEEALAWIYFVYQWDYFTGLFKDGLVLAKVTG
jgi:hypothetical protein